MAERGIPSIERNDLRHPTVIPLCYMAAGEFGRKDRRANASVLMRGLPAKLNPKRASAKKTALRFPPGSGCDSAAPVWNQLKGSWNLSLQTLGWGRYLAERDGQVPILWQATRGNPVSRKGYLLLAPGEANLALIQVNGTRVSESANQRTSEQSATNEFVASQPAVPQSATVSPYRWTTSQTASAVAGRPGT